MKRKIVIEDIEDFYTYIATTNNAYLIKYDNEIEKWYIEEYVEEV